MIWIVDNGTKALIIFIAILSFAGGFYLATILQKQIEVLIGAAIIIAFLSWIGSGTDFIGLIREWYKDKQDRKSKGDLEFGKPIKITKNSITFYFIEVINKRPNTFVRQCKGSLNINKYNTIHLNWRSNYDLTTDISIDDHLGLFSTEEKDDYTIIKIHMNKKGYDFDLAEFSNENVVIAITSDDGQVPKHYKTTITEIINSAVEVKSFTI